MFEFAAAGWLLTLPLPWLAWWALRRWPGRPAPRAALFHPHAALLAQLAAAAPPRPRRWPWWWLTACSLLVLALARPQWIDLLPGEYPARDFMLAIDISGSMRAQDFVIDQRPADRLAVVKNTVDELLAQRQGDRAGLIVFAGEVLTLSPVTHDLDLVRNLLREVEHGIAGEKTALGDAVALAVKRLRERPPAARIVLLFTDGANTAGDIAPARALALARQYHVRIYAVAVGKDGRVPFPSGPNNRLGLAELPIDETLLKQLAEESGGRFYRARDGGALQQIVKDIDALETVNVKLARLGTPHEVYWLPLLAGLLLLLAGQRRRAGGVLPS